MARPTPTTRTHRMDHNQPQQQPHRNPTPHRMPEDGRTRHHASAPPHPSSETKGPQAQQRDQGQQDSISSQQAAAPTHHRGQPHPGSNPEARCARAVTPKPATPGCRYYSSSEMYPLATKRAYSLSINISSGDSTMQLTRASLPPTFTPTPCGVTKVER